MKIEVLLLTARQECTGYGSGLLLLLLLLRSKHTASLSVALNQDVCRLLCNPLCLR